MRRAYLISVTIVALVRSSLCKELSPDRINAELYDSGLVHEGLMSQKMVSDLLLLLIHTNNIWAVYLGEARAARSL